MIATLPLLGQSGYQFLKLPASARIAAQGGVGISQADGDISLFFHNPAVLDSVLPGSYAFLWNPYLADINRLAASFQFGTKRLGNLAAGIVTTQYGKFAQTDDAGNDLGTFSANDHVIFIGKAHTLGSFSFGINAKFASIVLPMIRSSALLFDLGGLYRHPTQNLTVAWVVQNIGAQFGDRQYSGTIQPLVSVGTTFKPQYMPFRFTFTAYDLARERLYNIPDHNLNVSVPAKILSYLNVGTALILGDNLEFLAGYNQQRRTELRMTQGAYGAGLSLGILLRIRQMELRYSRMSYHAAAGTSFISIQGNFNTIKNLF